MSTEAKTTAKEKAEKAVELMKHHKEFLDRIGYDVMYKPKMFHTPKGKDTKHIIVFPSELKQGKDIYTEQIDHDGNSEDETRTLYKWRYNPQWAEAYTPVTKEGQRGVSWYLVPVSELVVVQEEERISDEALKLNDPDFDLPMDQMTMRDFFAIINKKPVSHKKWLNTLITNTK